MGLQTIQAKTSYLQFEGCTLSVRSGDESDLRWLTAFLDCGYEEVPPGEANYRVEFRVDPVAYDRLSQLGPAGGPAVEGFAQDSNPALFQCWSSSGEGRTFSHGGKSIFYVLSDDGTRVEIIARERARECRTALMRVVRELTMAWIVATGGTIVHGAAIRCSGGVVVISGPKRSGKTTLLMSLLQTTGARYVSNDRCVARLVEGGAIVRGIPTLVSIRRDTLQHFPALRTTLPDVAGDALQRARQRARSSFSIAPPQLRQLLGCRPASGGPLLGIVFPRVTDSPSRMTLRRLEPKDALDRFHGGLFRASNASVLGDVFAAGCARGLSPRDTATPLDSWVAGNVACLDCELGGGAAPGAEECIGLLDRISAQWRRAS